MGWATIKHGEWDSGVVTLGNHNRSAAFLLHEFRKWLAEVGTYDKVVYEGIPFMSFGKNWFGHFEGIMLEHFYPLEPISINQATLKKGITGNGRAKKPEMIAAVNKEFPMTPPITDNNEADALALLLFFQRIL